MAYSLTWLPQVLKDAGLKVARVPGWENRGRREMGKVLGVICHHTEHQASGNMPSLNTLIEGRSDLSGPLAQLGLARDGTFYVIAAGYCNHAGEGHWQGIVNGNANFIGIEAENRGSRSDPWPAVQMEAYRQGVAAILQHIGRGADFCVGHKEWARDRKDPDKQKHDPSFDMPSFRASVAMLLNGSVPPLPPIPSHEPPAAPGGAPGRPTLRRGMDHALVVEVQEALGVFPQSDHFGPRTEAAVRAFQRAHGMVPDGIVGPRTWMGIDAFRGHDGSGAPPAGPVQPFATLGLTGDRLAWGARVSPEFRAGVRAIAAKVGCDANDLMACMAFESGETFRADVPNQAGSGAVGLIQFMPSTARGLGTTTEALSAMTAEEQLDYVARYFAGYHGVRTLEDTYMAILYPRAIGKPLDYVLFASPSREYAQNKGLDRDGDGKVTKQEAAAAVRAALKKGLGPDLVG